MMDGRRELIHRTRTMETPIDKFGKVAVLLGGPSAECTGWGRLDLILRSAHVG